MCFGASHPMMWFFCWLFLLLVVSFFWCCYLLFFAVAPFVCAFVLESDFVKKIFVFFLVLKVVGWGRDKFFSWNCILHKTVFLCLYLMLPLGRCVICNYDKIYDLGYKTFSCFTQLNTKIIIIINVKMQTMVGILTFVSIKNTTPESLKARKEFIFSAF